MELIIVALLSVLLLMYWGKIFYDHGYEAGKKDRRYETGGEVYDASYPERSKRNGREITKLVLNKPLGPGEFCTHGRVWCEECGTD